MLLYFKLKIWLFPSLGTVSIDNPSTDPLLHIVTLRIYVKTCLCTCSSVSRDVPECLFGRTIGADNYFCRQRPRCLTDSNRVTSRLLPNFRFFLGAVAKSQKATVRFVMSVRPSVCPFVRTEQLGCHWTGFYEILF